MAAPVMPAWGNRSVVEERVSRHPEGDMPPALRDFIPPRGDADDQLVHRSAMAIGMAAARSSAIIRGPARSAARLQPNSAGCRLEAVMKLRQEPRNQAGEDVSGASAREIGRRRRCHRDLSVGTGNDSVRAFVDDNRIASARRLQGLLDLRSLERSKQVFELAVVRRQDRPLPGG